jgi:hypothetical protein
MKINYHKSDLTPMNLDENETHLYAKNFCCNVGSFPFQYLGVSLHFEKLGGGGGYSTNCEQNP